MGQPEINGRETTISSPRDENIQALDFLDSERVLYLPIKVFEKFPKLVCYRAQYCSLKVLAKEHFENLRYLRGLWCTHSQIQTIKKDAFDDLDSIEYLFLGENSLET